MYDMDNNFHKYSQVNMKMDCFTLQICQQEALFTDMSTLMALCKKAACDIRSCLNTLQVSAGG